MANIFFPSKGIGSDVYDVPRQGQNYVADPLSNAEPNSSRATPTPNDSANHVPSSGDSRYYTIAGCGPLTQTVNEEGEPLDQLKQGN